MRMSYSTFRPQTSRSPLLFIPVPAALCVLLLLGCNSNSLSNPDGGYSGTNITFGFGGSMTGTTGTGVGGSVITGTGAAGATTTSGTGTGGKGNAGTALGGRGSAGTGTGGRGGVGGKGTGGTTTGGTGGNSGTTAVGGAGGTTGDAGDCAPFSFFVTSLVAMQRESGSDQGFGGDLGGLVGADELCRKIAETSLSCAGKKVWKAFLSTSKENAIERIGSGPWYDRRGRLVSKTTADLLQARPATADTAIKNDLPNEDGVPNHNPGTGQVDNHDILTGTNAQGKYIGSAAGTCSDWTSAVGSTGKPTIGHSWPRSGGGGGGEAANWISSHTAPGCAAGFNLSDSGGGGSGTCVGCAGGYGGIYCFALSP
jgi:hypothetical protein